MTWYSWSWCAPVNYGPVAVNDVLTVTENEGVDGTDINILTNDYDRDSAFSLKSVNGNTAFANAWTTLSGGSRIWVGSNGAIDFDAAGKYEYLAAGQTASVSFSYVIRDAYGLEACATVTICITGVNDLTDGSETSTVAEDAGLTSLINVLANTYDPEAGEPTVVGVSTGSGTISSANVGTLVQGSSGGQFVIKANGTASFNPNGAFDYLEPGQTATTSVTYAVRDAAGTVVQSTYTVTVTGKATPVASVDAIDDHYSVGETQDVLSNLLTNDKVNGVAATAGQLSVTAVNVPGLGSVAVGTSFTVTTAGGRSGTVKVNADGTFSFDGGDNFVNLLTGQTDSFTLTYTVKATTGPVPGSTICVEAEHMNLCNYDIECHGSGSGGYWVKGRANCWSSASTNFTGKSGTYNIDVNCIDENDGRGQMKIFVNGVCVSGVINLDADTCGDGTSFGGFRTISLSNLKLNCNDKVEIQCCSNGGEWARIDCVKFVACTTGTTVTDTATVKVTINGEGVPVSVDAVNDFIVVTESEEAGDLESLTSGATSILANDTTESGAYAGQVVTVNGVSGNVGQWIDLARGRIKINANGTVDFDADGDFDALNEGQSEQVQVTYSISKPNGAASLDGKLNYDFWNHVPGNDTIANIPTTAGEYRGTVGNLDVNALATSLTGDSDTYKIRYTGNMLITEGGSYSFTVGGDDGVGIYIDGVLVAARDGGHPMEYATGSITLGAGSHSIEIRFFEIYGGQGLELTYKGPDTGGTNGSIFTAVSSKPITTGTVTDSATVTVTVEGEDALCTVDALDNSYSVAETEDVAANIIADDLLNGSVAPAGALTVVEVAALGTANVGIGAVGSSFTVTTVGGRTGTVTVNADGSFTFDGGNNFVDLIDGQTDRFQIEYTVRAPCSEVARHNLLFVLDISNSTVNGNNTANDTFDGESVGDVNGDGTANTVLDAQLRGVISAVQNLLAQGVDPSLIDVGIITFSGKADGFATVDAATLGTFDLNDPNLISTVLGITRGGWTNYEAGLKQAVSWFAGQQGDGAVNKMYFLSDGRPVIGSDANGNPIFQTTANYGDEVNTLKNTYGVEIHGIGVGGNSDLDYLNDLDNTGGAEQVRNTTTLTAMLEETTSVFIEDTATVTVVINGKGQPNLLPGAVNDLIVTDEDTAATPINVLANDNQGDGPATVVAVQGGTVGQPIILTTTEDGQTLTATAILSANGTLTLVPDAAFDLLDRDESRSFTLNYTIRDANGDQSTATITLRIDGLNEAPEAVADTVSGTERSTQLTGNVITNDSDPNGDAVFVLTAGGVAPGTSIALSGVSSLGRALGGTLMVMSNGSYGFTLGAGYTAMAEGETVVFTVPYTIKDGKAATDSSTLTITIRGINEGPEATDNAYETDDTETASGNLITDDTGQGADSDPNGDALTVSAVEGGSVGTGFVVATEDGRTGTLKVNANGTFTFVPLTGFDTLYSGITDRLTFSYTVVDPYGASDTATVTVTIFGRGNKTPLAADDLIVTDEASAATPVNVLDNDAGGDGNGPNQKTLVSVQNGTLGQPITLTATEDGQTLTATATLSDDGVLTLVPGPGFELLDADEVREFTLTYTIRDANGDTSTATITLQVNGLNEAPTATDNSYVITETETATGNILTDDTGSGHDADPNGDALSVTAIEGGSVGTSFSVSTEGGRSGTLLVNANGSFAFTPLSGFDTLDAGQTDRVVLDYTLSDGRATDTAELAIEITGESPAPSVMVNVAITVDVSSSMFADLGLLWSLDADYNGDDTSETPFDLVFFGIEAFVADLLEDLPENATANIALFGFDNASTSAFLVDSVDDVAAWWQSLVGIAGTSGQSNYSAALEATRAWFESSGITASPDNTNVVYLLSDGLATSLGGEAPPADVADGLEADFDARVDGIYVGPAQQATSDTLAVLNGIDTDGPFGAGLALNESTMLNALLAQDVLDLI